MKKIDWLSMTFIVLVISFFSLLFYSLITGDYNTQRIPNSEKRIVFKTEIYGKFKQYKSVLYHNGETDSFHKSEEGFFLQKGDTVVYSDECTPWLSVEKIIFRH